METATLKCPTINCMHCVMTVKKAVGSLKGISSVDADPDSKDVVVKYDPGVVQLSTIESKLSEAGYPVAK